MSEGDDTSAQGGIRGFTLLELSIVLVLIAAIISGGLAILTSSLQASQYNVTVARMDKIEQTLLYFAIANGRIPCPSDLSQTVSSTTYGMEAGAGAGSSPGTGTGACTGATMVPTATFTASSGTAEGGVPTRALQLSDDYMYDGWGRRFRYAADPTMTVAGALPFPTGLCSVPSASAITVSDYAGAVRTTAGIYALISHGANGHGAYTSNGVMLNAGSTNTNELANCHCNSSAVSNASYTPTYVEQTPTLDPTTMTDNFDDIVTFKEGWQLQAQNFLWRGSCELIYVADQGNNRVEVFNTGDVFVMGIGAGYNGVSGSIGGWGSLSGQFSSPTGIALDSSGNIWVADNGNNRVEKFSSSGSFLSQFPCASGACTPSAANGQLGGGPSGIAIDSGGNIWVADYNNYRVEKFSSSGTFLLGIGAGYQGVGGTIGQSGAGNGQFPCGTNNITFDNSGYVWVSDDCTNNPQQFSSSGTWMATIATVPCCMHGGHARVAPQDPYQMAVDSSSNLWVTDNAGGDVPAYNTTTGNSVLSGGPSSGSFVNPSGIAIDPSGNFWVSDGTNNNVQEFNASGTYLGQIGCASGACAGGSTNGLLSGPGDIAIGTSSR